jgi:hypothetical protein
MSIKKLIFIGEKQPYSHPIPEKGCHHGNKFHISSAKSKINANRPIIQIPPVGETFLSGFCMVFSKQYPVSGR